MPPQLPPQKTNKKLVSYVEYQLFIYGKWFMLLSFGVRGYIVLYNNHHSLKAYYLVVYDFSLTFCV